MRPSDEKFMDNTNFLIGEFNPLYGHGQESAKDTSAGCGVWLGDEFHKSIGGTRENPKLFSVQTVIQGIMEHQKLWTLH